MAEKNLKDTVQTYWVAEKDDSPAAYKALPCLRDSSDADVKIEIIFSEL